MILRAEKIGTGRARRRADGAASVGGKGTIAGGMMIYRLDGKETARGRKQRNDHGVEIV